MKCQHPSQTLSLLDSEHPCKVRLYLLSSHLTVNQSSVYIMAVPDKCGNTRLVKGGAAIQREVLSGSKCQSSSFLLVGKELRTPKNDTRVEDAV